jgi:hypothetical protein
MATITTTIEIDNAELMDNVFDGIFVSTSPWVYRFSYGSYDEDPIVPVEFDNGEGGEAMMLVGPDALARGWGWLVENGWHHCGEPITLDFDCFDACVTDMILQVAIFGRVIYG